ncbi:FAD/NAD(P)-binding oxidoreductase family protein [Striga asiatica]|uniref:FAD/NAD(P)-binding oxidoreductase family protein n=1 Tax=Striga asiatica TaxID=4170 RepID=A0A5A7RGY3_STRAF|nr:FAD/NAD(P)-binding oxidoreductase family protein [Striga asiatica]
MATAWGAFWGTRVLQIVKKHDSGGLLWKRIKLTPTRKANAKKRLRRVWQLLTDDSASCCRNYSIDFLAIEAARSYIKEHNMNEAVLRACSEPPPQKISHSEGEKVDPKES